MFCNDCKQPMKVTGNNQKRCVPCREMNSKLCAKELHKRSYERKGYTLKGADHHNYKSGIGLYKKLRKPNCEFCDVATKNLCVHHIDENRSNNKPDNLATLCRSCHVVIHGAVDRKDFLGRFTIKE